MAAAAAKPRAFQVPSDRGAGLIVSYAKPSSINVSRLVDEFQKLTPPKVVLVPSSDAIAHTAVLHIIFFDAFYGRTKLVDVEKYVSETRSASARNVLVVVREFDEQTQVGLDIVQQYSGEELKLPPDVPRLSMDRVSKDQMMEFDSKKNILNNEMVLRLRQVAADARGRMVMDLWVRRAMMPLKLLPVPAPGSMPPPAPQTPRRTSVLAIARRSAKKEELRIETKEPSPAVEEEPRRGVVSEDPRVAYYTKYLKTKVRLVRNIGGFYVMAASLKIMNDITFMPSDEILNDIVLKCSGDEKADDDNVISDILLAKRGDVDDKDQEHVIAALGEIKTIQDLTPNQRFVFVLYNLESNVLAALRKQVAEYVEAATNYPTRKIRRARARRPLVFEEDDDEPATVAVADDGDDIPQREPTPEPELDYADVL